MIKNSVQYVYKALVADEAKVHLSLVLDDPLNKSAGSFGREKYKL